jgi:transposase
VLEWVAKSPRIQLHPLPAYSPNLNAIEPAWKIMHTVNKQIGDISSLGAARLDVPKHSVVLNGPSREALPV